MKRQIEINDAVKIGNWEEVDDLQLSQVTKNDADTEKLSGLIIRGYETKFGKTNENGEQYTKDALDDFVERYFIKGGFNLPVDIQHCQDLQHLCGRVLLVEVNSVGFYFVAYVPRTYEHYDIVKQRVQEGILQGFSKYGFATDYELKKGNGGEYMLIKKFDLLSVSLVATPANISRFEKVHETKNRLTYRREKPKLTDLIKN